MTLEACLLVAALLLLGVAVRAAVPGLRRILVPASVIGGLAGLAVLAGLGLLGAGGADAAGGAADSPAPAAAWASEVSAVLRGWPGVLIAVVFAGLLLERRPPETERHRGRDALRAGLVVWVIVVGQIALGLAIGPLVFAAVDGTAAPPSAGQLLEATYAGGHGTGGAMGALWGEADPPWGAGLDLAMVMATIGLVGSIALGLVLANVGARRGWTRVPVAALATPAGGGGRDGGDAAGEPGPRAGVLPRGAPRPATYATVEEDVADPLAVQLALVGLAFGLGWLMQRAFLALLGLMAAPDAPADALANRVVGALDNVPLFLFTLLGGWALRGLLVAAGAERLIDTASIKRIGATAMELLIVAALASLRIEVLATYWLPVLVLCLAGFGWATVVLVVLSPRLLPRHCWFELGLINFGMSTGTTAQGMMLLRTVDPDLESGAAETYALAAPMSAPFVGGGILTFLLPTVALAAGPWPIAAVAAVVAVAIGLAARRLAGSDTAR